LGSTARIARAITDELQHIGQEAELHEIDEFEPRMLEGVDLVLIGSPTHHHSATPRTRDLAHTVGELCSMNVVAAAFDTEIGGVIHGSAADVLDRNLRICGLTTAQPGRFRLVHTRGPLAEGEIEHAMDWLHDVVLTLPV
jgi:flavorubredoxin